MTDLLLAAAMAIAALGYVELAIRLQRRAR